RFAYQRTQLLILAEAAKAGSRETHEMPVGSTTTDTQVILAHKSLGNPAINPELLRRTGLQPVDLRADAATDRLPLVPLAGTGCRQRFLSGRNYPGRKVHPLPAHHRGWGKAISSRYPSVEKARGEVSLQLPAYKRGRAPLPAGVHA